MSFNVDVAIVGGSLAGASVALALENKGFCVAVFEKDLFPRKKICGEGLSYIGLNELYNLGLTEKLNHINKTVLLGYEFINSKSKSNILKLSDSLVSNRLLSKTAQKRIKDCGFNNGFGVGIKRESIDLFLFEQISSNSKFSGQKVTNIEIKNDCIKLQTKDVECTAKYLVIADGAYSQCSKLIGIPTQEKLTDRVGISIAVKHEQKNNSFVKIINKDGFDACLTPVDSTDYNLSIMCSSGLLLEPSAISKVIGKTLDDFGIDSTSDVSEFLTTSGISRYQRTPYFNRVFVIGDSLVQLDPIGGMGMSNALVSARVTANTLKSIFASGLSESAINSHTKELYSETRVLKAFTFASILSNKNRLLGALKTSHFARKTCKLVHQDLPLANRLSIRNSFIPKKINFSSSFIACLFLKLISMADK